MKNFLTLLAVLTTFGLSAQTFQWNEKGATPTAHPKEVQVNAPAMQAYDRAYNEKQSGLAGIYNPNAEGSQTIFGETYRGRELTASHALLPLGTLARVTNLDNGREVTVRINDKGQECADCLIMLSSAAARQLGINYRARVTVERTGFSNWNPAPPATVAVPTQQPTTYNYQPAATTPATYRTPTNTTYPAPQAGVVRPATIGGNDYGWEAKAAPAPAPAPAPAAYGNYATLGAPTNGSGVTTREVQPGYSTGTYRPAPTVYAAPAPVTAPTTYTTAPAASPQPAPVYRTTTAPVYQPAAPAVAQPTTTVAPPPSTVRMYQQTARGGDVATPPTPVVYNSAPAAAAPAAAAPAAAPYAVQLAAYNNEMYAQRRVAELQAAGLPNAFYLSVPKADGQIINRVYAGRYVGPAQAQQAANQIRTSLNIAGIVTRP